MCADCKATAAAFEDVVIGGYRPPSPPAATPPVVTDKLASFEPTGYFSEYTGVRPLETRVKDATTGGEKGQKDAQFSLLPWDVLSKLAEHYAKGAKKYSRNNWRKGYAWSLAVDALGRHLAAFLEGETYDPETGSHHMLAVMFHAASLVYFTDAHPELDDRRHSVADNPDQ